VAFICDPKQLALETQREILHPAILVAMGIKCDSGYIDVEVEWRIQYAIAVFAKGSDKSFVLVHHTLNDDYELEYFD